MKLIWKVLAWIFVACGLLTYLIGWTGLMLGTVIWIPAEIWWFDAIASSIFGLFFLAWGALSEKRRLKNKRR